MARIKQGIVKISGKMEDKVFVDGKHGQLVRKAPAKGRKRKETALKQQYSRTKYLNQLAAELNHLVAGYARYLKPTDFYQQLQQRFRQEPLNNRFLLLYQLKDMEINRKYQLSHLGSQEITTVLTNKQLVITLQVTFHPLKKRGRGSFNSHFYEVILISWAGKNKPAVHTRQYSDWIYVDKGLPEFEFVFSLPAGTKHWLLCLKQCLGKNEEVFNMLAAAGMQVISAGSLDKKDEVLLQERLANKEVKRKIKNIVQVERVKAKRVL